MKKHFKDITAILIVLSTAVYTVRGQETNQIADKVYTEKAERLDKELENLHYQRIKIIDEVSPWRVRYNKIRNDLFELRRKELTDGMDSIIADKRKPLDQELAVLKQKRDSIQNNILQPLAQQRDTLYHQYALEITKKEPMQRIVRQMIHKRDSIDQEVKILYEELTRRGWNNEPRQDISDRILKTKRDSGAYFLHRDFIATLRNDATDRLQSKKFNSKTFRKEMRAIDKIEAALAYLGLPEGARVGWGDSWPYDVDDVNRRAIYQIKNNYARYREAYLATLPKYMRHVVLRRSNEQLDSIAESRYEESVQFVQQLSDAQRDSVLASYVKYPNAPAEFSTEIRSTTMEEFLLSPANSREEDIVRVFKDSPVYVVTLKKKQPDGGEIKITEQALLQKTFDYIWGVIYHAGEANNSASQENVLTYESARNHRSKYGQNAYFSTLSPEIHYALITYNNRRWNRPTDFENEQTRLHRYASLSVAERDSMLIRRLKRPEAEDTFVKISSSTLDQMITQPTDEAEKELLTVFSGFPVYKVSLMKRLSNGETTLITEQAVLQKTMNVIWGRAFFSADATRNMPPEVVSYQTMRSRESRYTHAYVYILPEDIRYAYFGARIGSAPGFYEKRLRYIETLTDTQRDSIIMGGRKVAPNEKVTVKEVIMNDDAVVEIQQMLRSDNEHLSDAVKCFRGYPVYIVSHIRESAGHYSNNIRIVFKETMSDIWGINRVRDTVY